VPLSGSPLRRTMAKPPAASASRIMPEIFECRGKARRAHGRRSGRVAVNDIDEQGVDRISARGGDKTLMHPLIPHQSRNRCQRLKMRCASLFGESRPNTQSTGMPSDEAKSTGFSSRRNAATGRGIGLEAGMRYGYTAPEARAAQGFALLDPLEHKRPVKPVDLAEAIRERAKDLRLGIGAHNAHRLRIYREESGHGTKNAGYSACTPDEERPMRPNAARRKRRIAKKA